MRRIEIDFSTNSVCIDGRTLSEDEVHAFLALDWRSGVRPATAPQRPASPQPNMNESAQD